MKNNYKLFKKPHENYNDYETYKRHCETYNKLYIELSLYITDYNYDQLNFIPMSENQFDKCLNNYNIPYIWVYGIKLDEYENVEANDLLFHLSIPDNLNQIGHENHFDNEKGGL